MSKKARRILAILNVPRRRTRVRDSLNRSTLDDVGPIGGAEQGMKVLSEMNSLADEHDQFMRGLAPRVDVLS